MSPDMVFLNSLLYGVLFQGSVRVSFKFFFFRFIERTSGISEGFLRRAIMSPKNTSGRNTDSLNNTVKDRRHINCLHFHPNIHKTRTNISFPEFLNSYLFRSPENGPIPHRMQKSSDTLLDEAVPDKL